MIPPNHTPTTQHTTQHTTTYLVLPVLAIVVIIVVIPERITQLLSIYPLLLLRGKSVAPLLGHDAGQQPPRPRSNLILPTPD